MPRAARLYKPNEPLKIEEVPKPSPSENEVLLEVKAAGLCHSDVHIRHGFPPLMRPTTLGHEFAGEVVEVGDNVRELKRGDRGVVLFAPFCGKCKNCVAGNETKCLNKTLAGFYGLSADGGFAEYCKVGSNRMVVVPQEVPWDFAATLGCAGLTAYHTVNAVAGVGPDDYVCLYGAGGVGSYAVQFAKLAGAKKVIAIGRNEQKLRMAKELGADQVINAGGSNAANVVEEVRKVSNGNGVDVMIDFVMNEESIENSIGNIMMMKPGAVASGGRVVVVGLPTTPTASYSPFSIMANEFSVLGSAGGTRKDLREILELAKNKRLKSIVTQRISLDQVNEGLDLLEKGQVSGRCAIAT